MSVLSEEKGFTIDDIEALPEGKRAELIDGHMYGMAPPSRMHQEMVMRLLVAIVNHIDSSGGKCRAYPAPFAVRLFDDNVNYVEPDISVICDPGKLTDKGCSGAPDWIIEVLSPATWLHDVYRKLELYRAAGVREYWIVNPRDASVVVHAFPDSAVYSFDDSIPVSIWEGFSIRLASLL